MSPDKGKSKSGKTRTVARPSQTRTPATHEAQRPRHSTVQWTIRPASERSRKQWQEAVAAEPELMAAERERLQIRPLDRSANPRRTARLRAGLAIRLIGDKRLPQWQHEITAAGRIWYCPDKDTRTVWITQVDLRHPKRTD